MTRPVTWLTRAVLVAAALAAALVFGTPAAGRWTMLRQVGLAGWRAESGRRCDDPHGTPWRHCYGRTRADDGLGPLAESVSVDRRTGQLTAIERAWGLEDSTTWARQQDSVARALARHGGEPIACPTPDSGSEESEGRASIAAWRLPEQDVRMIASKVYWREAPGSGEGASRWWIQVSGRPVGFSGCGPPVRVTRLLTPREMAAIIWRWVDGPGN